MLKRTRHQKYFDDIVRLGAKLHLITDGDIAAAIMSVTNQNDIDIYYGVGGAPEGVIAAAAISMLGGYMEGRLVAYDEEQKRRAINLIGKDYNKKYTASEMASMNGEMLFVVTGITSGPIVSGIRMENDQLITESLWIYRDGSGMVCKQHSTRKTNQ
jgi:fructose-1,6-bisphosphatase/sedoheptulose 1,7-bisphosphatase-like protein